MVILNKISRVSVNQTKHLKNTVAELNNMKRKKKKPAYSSATLREKGYLPSSAYIREQMPMIVGVIDRERK